MQPHKLFATTGDGVRLMVRHFPASEETAPAVLLLHGFAQNHRCFDAPGRSFARHLVHHGFHVFVGQLRGRHASHRGARTLPHGFIHHTDEDAPALLRVMRQHTPHSLQAMVGHSMGGLITAALPTEIGATLTARVAWCPPYHFLHWLRGARRPLTLWLRTVRAGMPFPLPTPMAGASLHAMQPLLDLGLRMPLAVWKPGSVEPKLLRWALRQGFAWEGWRVLADLLELGFTKGRHAGAVPVAHRVAAIHGPFLVGAAAEDGLAPPVSVKPLYAAASHAQRHFVQWDGFGHLDVVLGTRAPGAVWPDLTAFLRRACGLEHR